jgi:hypothetical protein
VAGAGWSVCAGMFLPLQLVQLLVLLLLVLLPHFV